MTNNTRDGNRSVRVVGVVGSLGLALMALSCAGNHTEDKLAPAASVGDEPPPASASAAPASGRGYLVVQAKVAGKVVPAHARLLRGERDSEIGLGDQLDVEAGDYRLEVTLADDSALIDKPTQTLDVSVEPYKKAIVDADFPWAKVQLKLLVQGREQPPTALKLLRNGSVVAEVKSGPPSFMISPGNYTVEVALRGKPQRVKDLAFFESSEQVIPVAVR
jgi:hypothetical protein